MSRRPRYRFSTFIVVVPCWIWLVMDVALLDGRASIADSRCDASIGGRFLCAESFRRHPAHKSAVGVRRRGVHGVGRAIEAGRRSQLSPATPAHIRQGETDQLFPDLLQLAHGGPSLRAGGPSGVNDEQNHLD